MSLATTLVVTSLALMLGLALAGTSISHLHLLGTQSRSMEAGAAAEAVLALAIEKVVSDREFGRDGAAGSFIEVDTERGRGRLAFDSTTAREWQIPVSLNNNFGGTSQQGWQGRAVPPEAIQLVAVGEVGGTRKVVEAVVEVPKFPFAIASSGPIESRGDLIVGGMSELAESAIDLKSLEPADLASNATVKLSGTTFMSGNVRAVGSIELGDSVILEGEVQPNSSPVPLAEINLEKIRPSFSSPLGSARSPVINHSYHSNDPQLVVQDGLTLDEGILYVNGDLVVRGGIRGTGAILVNGSVEIFDGANFTADNQLALVAKDDVVIHGSGQTGSYFQGLIYTEGDLVASDVTLLGTFVANRKSTAVDVGSRLVLNNVAVVHHADYGSVRTELPALQRFEIRWHQDAWEPGLPVTGTAEQAQRLGTLLSAIHDPRSAVGLANTSGSNVQEARELLSEMMGKDAELSGTNPNTAGGFDSDLLTEMTSSSTPNLSAAGAGQSPSSSSSVSPGFVFEFDLNQYLSELGRNRIIFWKEH